jgi:hypothetical protein
MMCGSGQAQPAAAAEQYTPAQGGGMMCGAGQTADDPMADKPAQPQQQSGMMCPCCRNMMAMMMRGGGMGGTG